MLRYVRLGEIPRKRHTQFRKPGGSLCAEQVFGTEGFSGSASILCYTHPPTQTAHATPLTPCVPTVCPIYLCAVTT